MDKYKTSELGKALKKVFHGEMSIDESVALARGEIATIFADKHNNPPMPKVDTGKLGQIVGDCPLCKRHVVRGKYNYGCMGYSDGCNFKMGVSICRRDIPISEAARLLATGETAVLTDFVSKNGKRFKAKLVLKGAEVGFKFD